MSQQHTARIWIERLQLEPHPEGGYYRETYAAAEVIPAGTLAQFDAPRACCTGIYYLLANADVSHLHRIKSDEMWHFYAGTGLVIHVFRPDGSYEAHHLGAEVGAFQYVVPAGCWFGAEVESGQGYALVGCTVSPGFDFHDFELAERQQMLMYYPGEATAILRLT